MNASALLVKSGAPTITLADAELRGILTHRTSRSQRVDRLLDGHLDAQSPDYLAEIMPLLAAAGTKQWDRVKDSLLLPEPAHLTAFVEARDRRTMQAERAASDFAVARAEIDRLVADWYQLPAALCPVVDWDLPFSYRNARVAAFEEEASATEDPELTAVE